MKTMTIKKSTPALMLKALRVQTGLKAGAKALDVDANPWGSDIHPHLWSIDPNTTR